MSEPVAHEPAAVASPPPRASALRRFLALDLLDNRYPALHGLRFWAILSVVQYHVTFMLAAEERLPIDPTFVDVSNAIFFGMDLFFILSGFLIGSILLRSLEVHGTQNVRRFYVRRIFRTFPSYYLVLTYLVLTTALTEAQRGHLWLEYAYLTNFSSLHRDQIIMFWGWSLALEEQFYLTVPLLMLLLHRLRSDPARIALLVVIALGALASRIGVYLDGAPWNDLELYSAVYFRTHTRFDAIITGIILAIVQMRYGARIGEWLREPFHRALLALPSLLFLWVVIHPAVFGEEYIQEVRLFIWGTGTSLMYFPALLLVLHGDGWFQRFLSAPIFRRLATLGYGVYLVHIPIIDRALVPIAHAMDDAGVSMAIAWPLALLAVMGGSFAIAYALHILVEKPSLKIREMLAA